MLKLDGMGPPRGLAGYTTIYLRAMVLAVTTSRNCRTDISLRNVAAAAAAGEHLREVACLDPHAPVCRSVLR